MLYDLGFFIFSILYLPALIFKGKLHSSFAERFGIFDKSKERALSSGKDRIWIQAVSVGEVALCKSIIPLLKERFPSNDIIISTITKAGNDLARKNFSHDAIIIYFPLDFSFVVKKAVRLIKPGLYIMIETEIWPNLLRELAANSIPSVLINGRISDRSINKYRMIKPFLKNILDKINIFCMQDRIDADRIIELGAPVDRVHVTGNMKFDAHVSTNTKPVDAIRGSLGLGNNEDLMVAGSTHSGEEEIIVEVFKELSRGYPNLKLLIAPRHINRAGEVREIVKKAGSGPVIVLDTIGQLNDAYSVATIVFIGGSLVKYGGHNPIEPAVFGRAILFGPHMFNFKYISNIFLKNKAALLIFNKEDMAEKCRLLLKDPDARMALGENAKRTVAENRGATIKNIEAIAQVLR
jgi:3-deoxy-D-manno-octulosonic-acid transferase